MGTVRRIGSILNGLLTLALAFLLGCNLYSICARQLLHQVQPTVFGWSAAVVISGSMADTISVNDLIIAKAQEGYQTGDIISFLQGDTLVTHRIVEETPEGYLTKGDANNTPDPDPVPKENVVGKVRWIVPGAGNIIEGIRSPLGMLCIVLLGLGLFILPGMISEKQTGKFQK